MAEKTHARTYINMHVCKKLVGRRGTDRPRLRLLEGVTEDARELHTTNSGEQHHEINFNGRNS